MKHIVKVKKPVSTPLENKKGGPVKHDPMYNPGKRDTAQLRLSKSKNGSYLKGT